MLKRRKRISLLILRCGVNNRANTVCPQYCRRPTGPVISNLDLKRNFSLEMHREYTVTHTDEALSGSCVDLNSDFNFSILCKFNTLKKSSSCQIEAESKMPHQLLTLLKHNLCDTITNRWHLEISERMRQKPTTSKLSQLGLIFIELSTLFWTNNCLPKRAAPLTWRKWAAHIERRRNFCKYYIVYCGFLLRILMVIHWNNWIICLSWHGKQSCQQQNQFSFVV